MFLIAHHVAPSPIHGLGCFAAEPVAKGTEIWRFDPLLDVLIPETALRTLPPPVVRRILERAEYRANDGVYLLSTDGDAYMNHSDDPNFDDYGDYAVAARDIAAGEEITCNYRHCGIELNFPLRPALVQGSAR